MFADAVGHSVPRLRGSTARGIQTAKSGDDRLIETGAARGRMVMEFARLSVRLPKQRGSPGK